MELRQNLALVVSAPAVCRLPHRAWAHRQRWQVQRQRKQLLLETVSSSELLQSQVECTGQGQILAIQLKQLCPVAEAQVVENDGGIEREREDLV